MSHKVSNSLFATSKRASVNKTECHNGKENNIGPQRVHTDIFKLKFYGVGCDFMAHSNILSLKDTQGCVRYVNKP